MRCYSCDRINASHFDGDTGRMYCGVCWPIIEDAIQSGFTGGGKTLVLTDEESYVTIEELMEEEQGITDAIREASSNSSDVS